MAVAATAVWEVRTTGSINNGGGFNSAASGTDYSQQDSPQWALTGLASSGAGNVVNYASAAATMVGNICQVISGTNFNTGFFEITSVSVGVSITFSTNNAGSSICSGVGASGVLNIGGAFNFNNTVADYNWAQIVKAGHKVWIKAGTYSTYGPSFGAGTATSPVLINGYNSSRGDNPTGASRPLFNVAATDTWIHAGYNSIANCIILGNNNSGSGYGVQLANGCNVVNCKIRNATTFGGNIGVGMASYCSLLNCEVICDRGYAVFASATQSIIGCYIHDSDIGIYTSTVNQTGVFAINNLIESCVTAAISVQGASVYRHIILNNTLYGSENKTGIGVSIIAGVSAITIAGNIIYGFATGVSHGDAVHNGLDYANDYYNNTADVSNWVKGAGTLALNPQFASVAQITGTNGTTSGSVLTSAGASFAGIVVNQDFCYLVSGSGITAGQYLITAFTATTLTLATAPGTNATNNKVFQVTTGRNFAIGLNLKAQGVPTAFGLVTNGYMDVGAVQRKEAAATSQTFVS